jgi:hypothetical protein
MVFIVGLYIIIYIGLLFVFTSFIMLRTGTALSNDNGHTLVTTVPRSGPSKDINLH